MRDLTTGDAVETMATLHNLRRAGWCVAVHNDYVQTGPANGEALLARTPMTFWLLTHPDTGRYIRGEGETDLEALRLCAAAARQWGEWDKQEERL